jgi:hypothetical protein
MNPLAEWKIECEPCDGSGMEGSNKARAKKMAYSVVVLGIISDAEGRVAK